MSAILRHQGQIIMQRRRRNHRVRHLHGAAGLSALALERVEYLLDRVGHWAATP